MEFTFSEDKASRAERFFSELLFYVEGEKAGLPFILEPWQRKIVRDVFGWLRPDGTRRYRIAYVEVPRKNGKSTFAAGIALYLLLADQEKRPQVYSCAGDRDQARIVFNAARAMIEKGSPILKSKAELRQYRINAKANDGWYEATSAEAPSAHGRNPSGIVFDELHTQPDRELWDAMLSGRGARRQPLVVAITTAGNDRSSICWEMHQRAKEAIRNPDADPTFYGVIYGAEEGDDWTSEEVWAKANPNLGVSVSLDFLRDECQAAKDNPAEENRFRNLYLDQWTEQAVRWIPMASWDACADEGLSLDDFAGEPCWGAIDLASTRDINALTLVFRRDDVFYAFPRFWMCEEPADIRGKQDRAQAKRWADQGFVKKTGGNTADHALIARDICEIAERFDLQRLAFDPWNSAALLQFLSMYGFDESRLEGGKFAQTINNFAGPSKEFEKRIAAGTLRHSGCPVMRWMVGNVAAERDKNDNIRPSKSKSADKIDGVVSTIMAIGLALQAGDTTSIYETSGGLAL
jgi:phage terminase large subunit-like protein